jgi:hypothetical protein
MVVASERQRDDRLPALTPDEQALASALRRHVVAISAAPRSLRHYESLQRTVAYIDEECDIGSPGYREVRRVRQ